MRLTAKNLELFDMPGKGEAANAISTAVTVATKEAIRKIGRKFDMGRSLRIMAGALADHVYPVLDIYARYGAHDTEPRAAIRSEMCNRIAKRYGLDSDDLYYRF